MRRRQRHRRVALAMWVTGSHWGREETGRWEQLPREQRLCPHCGNGIETVDHMALHCPLYDPLRTRFADLFTAQPTTLHEFLQQPAPRLASFAAACHKLWQAASAEPP